MLKTLTTRMVPPLINRAILPGKQSWRVDLAPRLNLFAGDNGLGKTVLLDLVWYCISLTWNERAVLPYRVEKEPSKGNEDSTPEHRLSGLTSFEVAEISALFEQEGKNFEHASRFDFANDEWLIDTPLTEKRGVMIYAKANGTYAVWDSDRTPRLDGKFDEAPFYDSMRNERLPDCFRFTSEQVLNGISTGGNVWCRGLLNDWVLWKYAPEWKLVFEIFQDMLEVLSPNDEPIRAGNPKRISALGAEIYPVLNLPYGPVPVHFASSGIRRVVEIAYLLVWSIVESATHSIVSRDRYPSDITFIVDELELHLHPNWQRTVLPSLLESAKRICEVIAANGKVPNVQIFATSHSPLILASLEGKFEDSKDSIKVLDYSSKDKSIFLSDFNMSKFGDASKWLTSPVFGLSSARSKEGENAISEAKKYLLTRIGNKQEIEHLLSTSIPDNDIFWVMWNLNGLTKDKVERD